MIVSIIVAMDRRRGIGWQGSLPWRLPADLKRFRALTMGHHIVMGRKTYESIGKPLPGRNTIVVTGNPAYSAEGCDIASSLGEAVKLARDRGESELFLCGGAQIYDRALQLADRIYLTEVEAEVDADTFFPEFDEHAWVELNCEAHSAEEKNEYPFTFKLLVRKDAAASGQQA